MSEIVFPALVFWAIMTGFILISILFGNWVVTGDIEWVKTQIDLCFRSFYVRLFFAIDGVLFFILLILFAYYSD